MSAATMRPVRSAQLRSAEGLAPSLPPDRPGYLRSAALRHQSRL